MRNILLIFVAVMLAVSPSCKTSEANYRAAYERAVAKRDSVDNETAVYGRGRSLGASTVISGTDTIECRTQRVAMTEPGDKSPAYHDKFNVVVGQFKQKFNALSLRDRLHKAGYKDAVVVQNGEPFYFVILSAHEKRQDAIEALKAISADFPIRMREPLPYLLYTP